MQYAIITGHATHTMGPDWTVQDSHNEPEADEQSLVEAALQDRVAFVALYRKYAKSVYRYFYHQVGNTADAEDLTSSTFSKALSSLARYERQGTFAAWLFGIARHTLLDYRRVHRVEVDVALVASTLQDPAPQPETQLLLAEEADALRHLVQQLPDDQREALVLRIFGELRTKEVAAVLGRSEGSVKMLVHRAVVTLRARYIQETKS
jgi:RNA polymerase sigma-70 factor (ECF subfamily)